MQVTPTWTAARKRLGSAARWAAREARRVPLASSARIWPSRREISEISATLNSPPSMMKTRTSAASPRVSFTAGQSRSSRATASAGRPGRCPAGRRIPHPAAVMRGCVRPVNRAGTLCNGQSIPQGDP